MRETGCSMSRLLLVGLAALCVLAPARTTKAESADRTSAVRIGPLAAFDSRTGEWVEDFPRVSDKQFVDAVVADGIGGFYVGGRFGRLGGVACPNLAHVLASHRVDRGWCPAPNKPVRALVVAGDTLFVGGESFTRLAGQRRRGMAAFSTRTGRLLPFDAHLGTGYVVHLAHDPYRDRLIVTGELDDRAPSESLRAYDANTGRVFRAFVPHPDANHYGDSAEGAVAGRSAIFVWGYFSRIGGKDRDGDAAVDPTTGKALASIGIATWTTQTATGDADMVLATIWQPSVAVAAFARSDGRMLWRSPLGFPNDEPGEGLAVTHNRVFASVDRGGVTGRILCFERATGRRCRSITSPRLRADERAFVPGTVVSAMAADGRLLVAAGEFSTVIRG